MRVRVPGAGVAGLGHPQVGTLLLPAGLEAWYYGPLDADSANTNIAPAINTLIAVPFAKLNAGIVDRIAFSLNIVGGAGSVARVGLYDNNPVNFQPRNLLIDGGQQATDAGVGMKVTNIQQLIPASTIVWLTYLCGVAAPTISGTATFTSGPPFFGFNNSGGGNPQRGWSVAQAYGALPAIFPTAGLGFLATAGVPVLYLRYQ